MSVNWPLVMVLFFLCIPGIFIAIKRLIFFLLPDNSEALKTRMSYFAIAQTLVMVFILCLSGSIVANATGLGAPILRGLLEGTASIRAIVPILLPAFGYSLLNLFIFTSMLQLLSRYSLQENDRKIMRNLRKALGLDGCVLYGGVVEEVIARWGLFNLAAFFMVIFNQGISTNLVWLALVVSSLIFAVGQLPAYIAAGCTSSRTFIYSFVLLSTTQSILFGYVFWHYGLIAAIFSHMLFHLGWYVLEEKINLAPFSK